MKKFLFLFFIQHVLSVDLPIVSTTQGLVRGVVAENGAFYKYLGIPYALVNRENPFGFSSPHPSFNATFDAVDDTAMCPQIDITSGTLLGSLNCLHLSVFAPTSASTNNSLPVLVFIHGGAFALGFYGSYLYAPEFLIRHNIIVVTLNYRLGPFGFMCTDHPRVPGNQGLKDQLIALRWVNENIGNFGGDPNKVTVVGSSAGSTSADMQMIRQDDGPRLFHQVILQSGSAYMPLYMPPIKNAPLILSQHFGLQTNDMDEAIDFLATIDPLQIILEASQAGLVFAPCVEQHFEGSEPFLTENWMKTDVLPGVKDYNILTGVNANEALGLYVIPGQDLSNAVSDSLSPTFAIDHEDFIGFETVRQFFFGDDEIDENKLQEAIDLRSDLSFVYHSIRSIKRWLKNDVEKLYFYLFSYDGGRNLVKRRLNTTIEGAVHGDEVGYLWDVSYLEVPTPEDQMVVDQMTAMWANFVKYGDPTPQITELLPIKWVPITDESPFHYMHMNDYLEMGTRLFHEREAFWDVFFELNGHLELYMMDF